MWNLSCFLAPLTRQRLTSSCAGARRVQELRQSAAGPPLGAVERCGGFGAEVFHSLDGNANITKGRRKRGPPSQTEQILPQVTWKLKPETCVSPFS